MSTLYAAQITALTQDLDYNSWFPVVSCMTLAKDLTTADILFFISENTR